LLFEQLVQAMASFGGGSDYGVASPNDCKSFALTNRDNGAR